MAAVFFQTNLGLGISGLGKWDNANRFFCRFLPEITYLHRNPEAGDFILLY